VGCETALWLAAKGKNVTIVEMLSELMNGGTPVPIQVKMMLGDLLAGSAIDILTDTEVREITPEGVRLYRNQQDLMERRADTVALAVGMKANRRLPAALAARFPFTHALGDCRRPQNIMQAIWDAYEVARAI
jgi:2-enoate reductase